ncbi:YdcF family protein [Afifella pfennigii]|uniref:YdcF family protein n=1 Tax=Afifella pfennigii TaxID=209897 RepID=UPI0004799550|nr:YdcF family protein [Afifella pfennigii]
MFFVLSKVGGFFLAPSNALLILAFLGAGLLMLRLPRLGGAALALALLGIAACGWGPLANWLILPLENRFPRPAASASPPDGIIVLGGALSDRVSALRGSGLEMTEAGDRVLAMISLAQAFPQARIVFSGGSGSLVFASPVAEAALVGGLAESFGLAPGRVEVESGSRNTAENAVFSRELAAPKPGETWWLVTSAYHMPRAIGAFRAAGFNVTAYPVDYRAAEDDWFLPFRRIGEGLQRTDIAFREWVGLLAYRFTGRIDTLFPGPEPG